MVAGAHELSGKGVAKASLVTEFGLAPDAVDRIVERLKGRGLIADVRGDINGYIPGRSASTISLDEVLKAFRSSDVEIADGSTSPVLRKLASDLDRARQERTHGVTIADLIPEQSAPTLRAEDDD